MRRELWQGNQFQKTAFFIKWTIWGSFMVTNVGDQKMANDSLHGTRCTVRWKSLTGVESVCLSRMPYRGV